MRMILWKTIQDYVINLQMCLPYDPAIPLLVIHSEETLGTCPPDDPWESVHKIFVYNSKKLETTQVTVNCRMHKLYHVHKMGEISS